MSVITSSRGGALIVHKGFLYRKRDTRKDTSRWCCVDTRCPVRASLFCRSGLFEVRNDHSHPSEQQQDVARRRNRAVLAAMVTGGSSSQELVEFIGKMPDLTDEERQDLIKYILTLRRRKHTAPVKPKKRPKMLQVGHDYEVIPSPRNRATLAHRGYVYRQNKVCGKGEGQPIGAVYWQCMGKKCPARARTNSAGLLEVSTHKHPHPPQAAAIADHLVKNKIKAAAMDLTRPLVEIIADFDVQDVLSKRYLRYIRRQEITNAELEEEKSAGNSSIEEKSAGTSSIEEAPADEISQPIAAPMAMDLPTEMLDLSASDLQYPSGMLDTFEVHEDNIVISLDEFLNIGVGDII